MIDEADSNPKLAGPYPSLLVSYQLQTMGDIVWQMVSTRVVFLWDNCQWHMSAENTCKGAEKAMDNFLWGMYPETLPCLCMYLNEMPQISPLAQHTYLIMYTFVLSLRDIYSTFGKRVTRGQWPY